MAQQPAQGQDEVRETRLPVITQPEFIPSYIPTPYTTNPHGPVPLTAGPNFMPPGASVKDAADPNVFGTRGGNRNKKRTGGKLRKHRKTKKGSRRHKSRKHHKKSSRRYHR